MKTLFCLFSDVVSAGCKNGTFGPDCSNHCSGNCLHNVSCNSINGHCDNGCASGYLEAFCNTSMCVHILQETNYYVRFNAIN